jgi:hypothetical protein
MTDPGCLQGDESVELPLLQVQDSTHAVHLVRGEHEDQRKWGELVVPPAQSRTRPRDHTLSRFSSRLIRE